MADKKISALTAKAAPIGADSLPIVDSVGGTTKKALLSKLPISDAVQTALNTKWATPVAQAAGTETLAEIVAILRVHGLII